MAVTTCDLSQNWKYNNCDLMYKHSVNNKTIAIEHDLKIRLLPITKIPKVKQIGKILSQKHKLKHIDNIKIISIIR